MVSQITQINSQALLKSDTELMAKFYIKLFTGIEQVTKYLIKVINRHYNNVLMMIKKEDHNTGVEKFLRKNLIKNFKKGALSRYLIKSIKKYFIKNFKSGALQGT